MQSGIFSAATTYCWGELDPITQKGILERVRLGCQEAVVRQEDTVEELSRAAVQAASLAAPSSESRSPAEAINILRLLTLESKLLSAEAAAKLEVRYTGLSCSHNDKSFKFLCIMAACMPECRLSSFYKHDRRFRVSNEEQLWMHDYFAL